MWEIGIKVTIGKLSWPFLIVPGLTTPSDLGLLLLPITPTTSSDRSSSRSTTAIHSTGCSPPRLPRIPGGTDLIFDSYGVTRIWT